MKLTRKNPVLAAVTRSSVSWFRSTRACPCSRYTLSPYVRRITIAPTLLRVYQWAGAWSCGCLTRLLLRMGLLLHRPILIRSFVSPLELSHDDHPSPAAQSPSDISFDIRSGIDQAAQGRHSNPIPSYKTSTIVPIVQASTHTV